MISTPGVDQNCDIYPGCRLKTPWVLGVRCRVQNVANCKVQAKYLFHLILDCAPDFIDVVKGIISGWNTGGEFALAVETRQQMGHTLNQSVRSHEGVVLVDDLL